MMEKERGLYLKAFILLIDEILIIGLLLLFLWKSGVRIPFWVLLSGVILCVGLYALFYYILSTQGRKAMFGRDGMVGFNCKVVQSLNPEGVVRVRGELWKAASQSGVIEEGKDVTVVNLEGLKLIVTPL